ncbi:hypothetical protein K435DRAFT_351063 [Dendrothele bispora CBS 962.96]|uniref:Uncharacterized protein n=1 Tax=Dendrothele bispora (strain CBS 962.96) TaxID=1314807 RepID=A0A4S8MI30_DENBC|nr:hypothetical protein K435DRAFT_351063 [Dendrothele bispora CBS 962.96]
MFNLTALSSFLFFVTLLLNANAAPLLARQNPSGPTTVMTVTNMMTPAGPLVQTCIITLNPITDKNGQPAFEEVKQSLLLAPIARLLPLPIARLPLLQTAHPRLPQIARLRLLPIARPRFPPTALLLRQPTVLLLLPLMVLFLLMYVT